MSAPSRSTFNIPESIAAGPLPQFGARCIEAALRRCYLQCMDQPPESANQLPPPEVFRVTTVQVACDGSGEVEPALGHPRVFLRIEPDLGWVECGYCDRRFILEGGPADQQAA